MEINLSEQLAKRIRKALGEFNDPTVPVQTLVESVVRQLQASKASSELLSKVEDMRKIT